MPTPGESITVHNWSNPGGDKHHGSASPGEVALIYAALEMRINAHNPQAPSVDVYSYGVLVCEVTTSTFPDRASFTGLLQLLESQWPDMHHIAEQCTQETRTRDQLFRM